MARGQVYGSILASSIRSSIGGLSALATGLWAGAAQGAGGHGAAGGCGSDRPDLHRLYAGDWRVLAGIRRSRRQLSAPRAFYADRVRGDWRLGSGWRAGLVYGLAVRSADGPVGLCRGHARRAWAG